MIRKSTQTKQTNLEITRHNFILIPRKRNAFDACMSLLFKRNNSLVEDDTLVFFCEHTHETFHKILRNQEKSGIETYVLRLKKNPYPDFIPNVIVAFEHIQMVLNRDNETMSIYQFVIHRAREVHSSAHSHYRSFWWRIILPKAKLA